MCDNCKFTGSWNILEKFLLIQKSNDKLKELEMLRATCNLEESFEEEWNKKIRNCQNVADMSTEEYNMLLNNFSLPVRTQKKTVLIFI